MAGTGSSYTKNEIGFSFRSIEKVTKTNAEILGIDNVTGTIDIGK